MNFLSIIIIFFPNYGFSKSIVADLSSDSISINTGFNGAELLLFGSFDGNKDLVTGLTKAIKSMSDVGGPGNSKSGKEIDRQYS